MEGEFIKVRLNPEIAQKLNTLARKTFRTKGMTIRLLIEVGFGLFNDQPDRFFNYFPKDNNSKEAKI